MHRSFSSVAICTVVLLLACEHAPAPDAYSGTPTVVGDTIRFTAADYVSPLVQPEYIGQLPGTSKAPFLIFSGVECSDCDAGRTVLMHSPSDGVVKISRGLAGWYPYPGAVIDGTSGDTVSNSRLFWGKCLPDRAPGMVEYATQFASGKPADSAVVVTEIRDDMLVSDTLHAPQATVEVTVAEMYQGGCQEVPPHERGVI